MDSFIQNAAHCKVCTNLLQGPLHYPLALKCLHTICQKCFTQMQRSNGVKCPFCNVTSPKHAVKKDFKTVGLVDAFVKQKEKAKNGEICQMCEETKPIEAKCQDCDKLICKSCTKVHQSIREIAHHRLTKIGDIVKDLVQKLTKVQSRMKEMKQQSLAQLKRQEQEKEYLDQEKQDVFDQIDAAEKQLVEKVKRHHQKLKHDITKAMQATLDRRSRNSKEFETFLKSLNKESGKVSCYLKEDNKSVVKGIQVLKDADAYLEHTVPPSSIGHLVFDISVYTSGSGIDTTFDMKSEYLAHNCYNKIKEAKMKGHVSKLQKYGNALWCIGESEIYVFSLECVLQKTIKLTLEDLSSLQLLESQHLLVACNRPLSSFTIGGIYVVSQNGLTLRSVAKGDFIEIKIYKGILYALNRLSCCIEIFQCTGRDTWSTINTLQLENYNIGDNMDTMVISKNIYIGSCVGHSVLVYNLEGQLLSQHCRTSEDAEVGILNSPRVSAGQEEGFILVADCGKQHQQVLSPSGKWSMVTLKNVRHIVWDLAISCDSIHIWSLEGGGKLMKYKVQT